MNKIIAITVSTRYDDLLEIIIPQNYKFFDKWYIITDKNDIATYFSTFDGLYFPLLKDDIIFQRTIVGVNCMDCQKDYYDFIEEDFIRKLESISIEEIEKLYFNGRYNIYNFFLIYAFFLYFSLNKNNFKMISFIEGEIKKIYLDDKNFYFVNLLTENISCNIINQDDFRKSKDLFYLLEI
jgi:hypothetical protein